MIYRIIVLMIALCSSSLVGWTAERFPFLGEVVSDKVTIRSGQDVNFERVDLIVKGTNLLVLEKHYDWYKIQLPSTAKAYIRVDYLKIVKEKIGQVTADRVNIRAGRSVNSTVLGQLTKGVFVRLITKFDDWIQIEPVEGLYGWVHKDFIKVKSYTIPSLTELDLAPVTVEAPIDEALAQVVTITREADFSGSVMIDGVIEKVELMGSPSKTIQYQIVTDDNKIYYLQIVPTVIENFVHRIVRLEGDLTVSDPESVVHPVLLVKNINFIL